MISSGPEGIAESASDGAEFTSSPVNQSRERMRAAVYVTATRSEFLVDPRVMVRDIERLRHFAEQLGCELSNGSNMDLPGVFYDPAESDRTNDPFSRDGFRQAFSSESKMLIVASLGRIAPSLGKLAEVLQRILAAGMVLGVADGELILTADWLRKVRDVIPLQKQTHGGRMRAAKAIGKLPGRPVKSMGRVPPYEIVHEVDGGSVRSPNFKVLRELAMADGLRSQGLTWGVVSDELENSLAMEEGRPPLDDEPVTVEKYIRKCGRSLHAADWDFRKFIEEHSFNRPAGKISRRWSRVRLIRILHEKRARLDAWLRQRDMVLLNFSSDQLGSGRDVSAVSKETVECQT